MSLCSMESKTWTVCVSLQGGRTYPRSLPRGSVFPGADQRAGSLASDEERPAHRKAGGNVEVPALALSTTASLLTFTRLESAIETSCV